MLILFGCCCGLQVQQLIQDAIDPDRLCYMFPGWAAWLWESLCFNLPEPSQSTFTFWTRQMHNRKEQTCLINKVQGGSCPAQCFPLDGWNFDMKFNCWIWRIGYQSRVMLPTWIKHVKCHYPFCLLGWNFNLKSTGSHESRTDYWTMLL